MNKKSKLIMFLILLFILIILFRGVFVSKQISYKLVVDDIKFSIKELYNKDNYYIEIEYNNKVFPYRIYEDLNSKRKIVNNIYVYSDDKVDCVLPIVDNKLYVDMSCFIDNVLYDYHVLLGQNSKLDKFVEQLDIYNINRFSNIASDTKTIGTTKINIHDSFKNDVAITTYKGLLINTTIIDLFEDDVYTNKLSTFIDNYYIIADYSSKYSFNYFYIVNLNTKSVSKIKSKNEISYDSYIQGVVDNKIYIYDKNSEVQYEIDLKNSKINIVSDKNYIKYYNHNKWEKMTKVKANKEIYFNYDTLDNNFTDYDYVKEVENYYYLFKKDGISYKLYRVDKNNIDIYKFILNVPVTNIKFNNNYLYYIYKNKLFYYSDQNGFKTILENSELEFNDTIKYYIY